MLWVILMCGIWTTLDGQSDPIKLNELVPTPHPFYSYSSAQVSSEIELLQETANPLSLEDVRDPSTSWVDIDDIQNDINREKVYWAHFVLQSNKADTVLLEFGLERHFTWRDIHYYVVSRDSIIASGQSGNRFLPRDKPIRSPVNLAQFPVSVGLNHFYCRLDGLEMITDDPIWYSRFHDLEPEVSFLIHDRDSYKTIDGFSFSGGYAENRRGHFFGTNYFKQGIEVYVNPPESMSIDTVAANWDDYATYQYNTHPHSDSTYWLRYKVIGTEEGPGNYLFGMGPGSHWNFDTIEVFTRALDDTWASQLTGNAVNPNDKVIGTDWNIFRVKAMPRETREVYLKLSGAGK